MRIFLLLISTLLVSQTAHSQGYSQECVNCPWNKVGSAYKPKPVYGSQDYRDYRSGSVNSPYNQVTPSYQRPSYDANPYGTQNNSGSRFNDNNPYRSPLLDR